MPRRKTWERSDKLCECGCGEYTLLSDRNGRGGIRTGEPLRFLAGHASRINGRKSKGPRGGNVHAGWTGDRVLYQGLHQWMNRNYPRIGRCEWCGTTKRRTEYARGRPDAKRNPADWFELCARCHRAFDGGAWNRGKKKVKDDGKKT